MKKGYSILCGFMVLCLVFVGSGFIASGKKDSYFAAAAGFSDIVNAYGNVCQQMFETVFDAVDFAADNVFEGINVLKMPDFYKDAQKRFSGEQPVKESLSDFIALWYAANGYIELNGSADSYTITGQVPYKVIEKMYLSDVWDYVYKERQGQMWYCIADSLGFLHLPIFYYQWYFGDYPYGAEEYLEVLVKAKDAGKSWYTSSDWYDHLPELLLDDNGQPYYSSP